MTALERPRRDLCSVDQEQDREGPHAHPSRCREGQRPSGAGDTAPAGCGEARGGFHAAGRLRRARAAQRRAAARQSGDFADRSREPPRRREADASAGEAGAPPAEGRSRSEDSRGLEDLATTSLPHRHGALRGSDVLMIFVAASLARLRGLGSDRRDEELAEAPLADGRVLRLVELGE